MVSLAGVRQGVRAWVWRELRNRGDGRRRAAEEQPVETETARRMIEESREVVPQSEGTQG